jgi:recombinational DNA repair protein RecT
MKTQELRKLIREEVKKVIKEQFDYTHVKPFKGDIQKMVSQLTTLNAKIEENGPLSEEIQDAIDTLNELFNKLR